MRLSYRLHDKKRKPCRDFLKVCRSEYDNLLESSPTIDLDIINMFNKKFEDKYPDVRKPIVCNGLKSIRPYRNEEEVIIDKVEEEEEEETISIVVNNDEP